MTQMQVELKVPQSTAPVVVPDLAEITSPFSGIIGVQRTVVAAPRRVIPDTDLSVFPVALGAHRFGRAVETDAAVEMLDRYREAGGNLIDTVDAVVARRTETLIGEWLRSRGCRDEMVLATTIGASTEFPGLTPANIVTAVDASLERLGVERLDLLFMRESAGVPVELEESLGAIDALIRSGKVSHIAASGFSAERLMQARVLGANGLPRFRAVQTPYNLAERTPFESSVELVARAQGLAVFPSSPLAHGLLASAKPGIDPDFEITRPGRPSMHFNRRLHRVRAVLDRIGNDHGVPAATIAIAALLARPGVVAPVSGARTHEELEALTAAPRVELTRADMLDLDRVTL